MSNRVNEQFGNYRLLRLVGKGGFAEVYLGEHIHLGSQVAVKILNTQLMTREQEEFLEEARIVAGLHHPSIVRVLDSGVREGDDTPYLVMNYAPNGTLRQRHAKGEIVPLPLVVSYVKQLASALQYAHTRKLIHRDIKPENMLIGEEQEILLSDFGIALVSASSASQSTKATAGTMAYMAPEQIMGKPRTASDQYALAVVVYEWLCGERPFHGGFSELCAQHLYAPPPSLHEKLPTISHKLESILFKALAKEPLKRYATMNDFAEALEAYSLRDGEEDAEEEEDADYDYLFNAGQVRGAYTPFSVQRAEQNTIAQLDSNALPAELALDLDIAALQVEEEIEAGTTDGLDSAATPQLEKTMLATPPVDRGYEKTQKSSPHSNKKQKIPLLDLARIHQTPQGRYVQRRYLLSLLLVVFILGSSFGLAPLLLHASQSGIDPGSQAHIVDTPTQTVGSIPTKGSTGTSKNPLSSTVGQVGKRQNTPDQASSPQLVVTAGQVPVTAPTQPSQSHTSIVTPTAIPTTVPTPVPTLMPTPTSTPTQTPTPTPTPTPTSTPVSVQPTLQASPTSYVNAFDNCTQDSRGGVGIVVYCNFTLSNTGGSIQVLNWTGAVNNSSYSLSPASGSLAPGQSESVTLTMGDTCPLSFTVTFTGPANTATVPVFCTQIRVTPSGQDFDSSKCQHETNGDWNCVVTVTASPSNMADTNWMASVSPSSSYVSPQKGTLAPGASTQVTIFIPASNCPGSNSFDFSVPGSTVDGLDNYLGLNC